MNDAKRRCEWATRELEIAYHDNEWGLPCHDDRLLFEYLLLDCSQAGLSWYLMLQKRENYRRAFDDFDPERIARYDDAMIERLLQDSGIVRNRRKIEAAIGNARGVLEIREQYGSLADYLWRFVDGQTIRNQWTRTEQVPVTTPQSDALSKDMRQRGFRFIGSTTIYAFMQGAGLVNDHLTSCFRYHEV